MSEPTPIYPKRSVVIQGVTARAVFRGLAPVAAPRNVGPIDVTPQFRTVKEADDVDREVGNPGDQHHCPLCNEYLGWEAFKAHAPQCIQARAPRTRLWVQGASNAIEAYKDSIPVERF